MSAVFFIRIIGGVFGGALGTYLSGKLYDYMYKYQRTAITFDDLFQRQIRQQIELSDIYDYDREEGNHHATDLLSSSSLTNMSDELITNIPPDENDFSDYYIFIGRENI